MLTPPRFAERLLGLAIADPEWRDSVLGDLREEFAATSARFGPTRARWWYRRQAMSLALHRATARLSRGSRMPQRLPEPVPDRAGLIGLLWYDLRQAWRSVRHHPALSATIVIVLGAALAANATIFAMADAIVLRPFRYPGVPRAVVIASDGHQRFFARESVTAGDFIDWNEQAGDVLQRLAAIEWWDPAYTHDGPPQRVNGFRVSPALFDILGTRAELGRTLTDADEHAAESAAVISHGFWTRQFAEAPDVLGRTIWLDGTPHRVVGVMPATFTVPFGADVWAPLRFAPEARADRKSGVYMVVARLTDGATPESAEGRLQVILAAQKKLSPDLYSKRQVSVRTFTDGFGDPGAGPFVGVLQMAAFLLLLVACANVANLLLARNTERERELAVRLALGASRTRLVWQLVLEALVLAGLASLLSLPLVWAGLQTTRAALPDAIRRFVPGIAYLSLQPATFAATALLAVAATLFAAIVPALRAARGSVSETLRPGTRVSDGAKRQRGRSILATGQIALTLALLATAGLSLNGLYRVTDGPIGFDSSSTLTGRVLLPEARYGDAQQRRLFLDGVLARLRSLPSVADAAAITALPYSGNYSLTHFWADDVQPLESNALSVVRRQMTPTALGLVRVRLLAGRMLAASDAAGSVPVALVSESLIHQAWATTSPIGQRFRLDPHGPAIIVVGVVADVKQDWVADPGMALVYLPAAQDPPYGFSIMLRTVADPVQLGANLRAAVQASDPELPVVDLKSMQQMVEDRTSGFRFAANTLGVIAIISCLLSAVGLYSLMSFLTMRRTREIGVRVALGATSWDVIKLTGATAVRLTTAGIVLGLLLVYLAGRAMEQALFGVVTSSLSLALGLAVMLAAVSLAASYVPARRAAAIEPTEALRTE